MGKRDQYQYCDKLIDSIQLANLAENEIDITFSLLIYSIHCYTNCYYVGKCINPVYRRRFSNIILNTVNTDSIMSIRTKNSFNVRGTRYEETELRYTFHQIFYVTVLNS